LKQFKEFDNMTVIETNGILIAAADIALPVKNGDIQTFRIAIVPHNLDYKIFN